MSNLNIGEYVYQEMKKACEELGVQWQSSFGDTLLEILWEQYETHPEQSTNAILKNIINSHVEAWKDNVLRQQGIY